MHALRSKHPLSRLPLWQDILKTVGSPGSASDTLEMHYSTLQDKWSQYVDLLSVWQFKRSFERSYGTVRPKPRADVVVVHPECRFTTARDNYQWLDACRWTLLAYRNHGPQCAATFADAHHLDSFADDALQYLTDQFIMTPPGGIYWALILLLVPLMSTIIGCWAWHAGRGIMSGNFARRKCCHRCLPLSLSLRKSHQCGTTNAMLT